MAWESMKNSKRVKKKGVSLVMLEEKDGKRNRGCLNGRGSERRNIYRDKDANRSVNFGSELFIVAHNQRPRASRNYCETGGYINKTSNTLFFFVE